jgi:hypothetical protein
LLIDKIRYHQRKAKTIHIYFFYCWDYSFFRMISKFLNKIELLWEIFIFFFLFIWKMYL